MQIDSLAVRYADVVLSIGLDFRPGRLLAIDCLIEHAQLARAIAELAYERGASYVDIWYFDPVAKQSRVRHAPTDTLANPPDWLDDRYERLTRTPSAYIRITGDPAPDLLAGLDPARAGLDQMPVLATRNDAQTRGLVEWTVCAWPSPGWATQIFGKPEVDRLTGLIAKFVRLTTPNPVGAWRAHVDELRRRAHALQRLDLDVLHYQGPGTDLNIGLPRDHLWVAAEIESARGVRHVINLPTEEVWTSPDPTRTNGTVRATRPLALAGTLVTDLELTFGDGCITHVSASNGADVVRAHIATDAGACRLGEVALISASSPVLQSGITFFETLLDENASSHLAWGSAIPHANRTFNPQQPDLVPPHLNHSAVHTDFMVGGSHIRITGIGRDGTRHVVLEGDEWQLLESW